jgi:hypothetical protein
MLGRLGDATPVIRVNSETAAQDYSGSSHLINPAHPSTGNPVKGAGREASRCDHE